MRSGRLLSAVAVVCLFVLVTGADAVVGEAAGSEPGPMSVRSIEGRAAFGGDGTRWLTWNTATSMPAGAGVVRYGFAQCSANPDSMYIISGVDESFAVVANVWRYDSTTDTWNALAPIPTPQEGSSAVCYENKIYVAGGGGATQFYIYDVATDSWSAGTDLPRGVWGAALGAWDGRLFMAGGDADFSFGDTSNAVDIYDIGSGLWNASGSTMPVAVVTAGWRQVGNYLYVIGGWTDDSPTSNSVESQRYDMENDTWQIGPVFPSGRADFALAVTARNLVAIGGDANGGGAFDASDQVELVDYTLFPLGQWQDAGAPLAAAVTALSSGACTEAASGGEIWAVGGYDGGSITGTAKFRQTYPCSPVSPSPGALIGVDGGNNSLVKYSRTGSVVAKHPFVSAVGTPVGVAVVGNEVWVAGTNDMAAPLDLRSGAMGPAVAASTSSIEALGSEGVYLYMGDYAAGQAEVYDTSGALLTTITLSPAPYMTGFDTDGTRIFVGSYDDSTVFVYDMTGALVSFFYTGIPLGTISGLSYDWGNDTVWVSTGFGSDEIINFDLSGVALGSFPANSPWINGLASQQYLFADAFESGNPYGWANVVP